MPFYLSDLNQQSITSRQIAEQLAMIVERNYFRRLNMQVRLDYYYDRQMKHLSTALEKQFRYPTRLNLQKEIVNITKMIVDELAGLYIEEPQRSIEGGTDKDIELYQYIIEQSELNSVMDTNNKLVKLCKTTLVRPVWRDDCIKYVIYTPNMYDVLENPNDPTKPLAIIYANNYDAEQYRSINDMHYERSQTTNQFAGTNIVYHVWTDSRYFTFGFELDKKTNEKKVIINANPDNESNMNPYQTLDIFVPFRDDYAYDGFFCDGGDDLILTNEMINIKKTELNYLTKMQSFSIPVRKGVTDTAKVFIADPSMTIDLPADTDLSKGSSFAFASPEAKIVELRDDINFKLRTIAQKYKLNPEMFTDSGSRSSAESIQLQNFYLMKAIKRDKPRYALAETKLFEATKIVQNAHGSGKFSDGCYLKINYSEVETPTSTTERDHHNLLLYSNGIMSKAEWLLKEDPDLGNIDEAKERLEQIELENGTTQQQTNALFG